jgi:hypothetical protein
MNLRWRHLPLIFIGGAIGSTLGWLVSLLFRPGLFPGIDSSLGLPAAGILFGGIAGAGLSVIRIVFRAARDPRSSPPAYFIRLHGMGSTLIGHADPHPDGSYVATEWFTMYYVPILPVCRYRVTKDEARSTPFSASYAIHEKFPVCWKDAAPVYGILLLALLGLTSFLYFLFQNAKVS